LLTKALFIQLNYENDGQQKSETHHIVLLNAPGANVYFPTYLFIRLLTYCVWWSANVKTVRYPENPVKVILVDA